MTHRGGATNDIVGSTDYRIDEVIPVLANTLSIDGNCMCGSKRKLTADPE